MRVAKTWVSYYGFVLNVCPQPGAVFFFSSRRRHTICGRDWSSDVCSSDLALHVPRQQYVNGLSGVPTIRVFEALACGVPLVCSPWSDDENLFHPGEDYLVATDGAQMKAQIAFLLKDDNAR